LSAIVLPAEDNPELKRVPSPLPSSESSNSLLLSWLDTVFDKKFVPIAAT